MNSLSTYLPETQHLFKTYSAASTFTGEALALIHCIDFICLKKITKASIFTDALSLVKAISSNPVKSKNFLLLLTKDKLRSVKSLNIEITIIWILSHTEILRNEAAKLLAKRVIRIRKFITSPIPHNDFYSVSLSHLQSITSEILSNQANSTGKQHFDLYPTFSSKSWFHKTYFSREEIVTVCRIRSNHYNLNSSLYKYKIVSSPACNCGNPIQDINHVFWYCPLFINHRKHLITSENY